MSDFVPQEAYGVSACLRGLSNNTRQIANELRSISASLELTWQGNACQEFILEFGPLAYSVESAASDLGNAASTIEHITVHRDDDPVTR